MRGKAEKSSQAAPLTSRVIPYGLDSGPLDNPTDEPKVVFDHTIFLGNEVSWVRVLFAEANLPQGSFIRLTSMYDGEFQTLDAQSLQNWGHSSAYFNGPAVRVELIAAAITIGNSLRLHDVTTGARNLQDEPVGITGICGGTDERAQSNDPRVARLLVYPQGGFVQSDPDCDGGLDVTCEDDEINTGTAFIIDVPAGPNQRLHATVGHAWPNIPVGGAVPYTILEFDVPPSTTESGRICHPCVCKQFPVDLVSVIHISPLVYGTANDYAVFRCLPNECDPATTTYEFSGFQAFPIEPPPVFGAPTRVTGYGQDGEFEDFGCACDGPCPAVPVGTPHPNRTQQCDDGTLDNPSTQYDWQVRFDVDVCIGNSGSPVIANFGPDCLGGSAFGILDGAFCSTIGYNEAFAFTHPGLQRAICHLADYGTSDVTISGNVLTVGPNPVPPVGVPFALRVSGDPRQPVAAGIELFVQSDWTLASTPYYANWPQSVQVILSQFGCGIQYAVERVFEPTSNRLNECIENYRIQGPTTTVAAEGCRYIAISSPCTHLAYRVVGDRADSEVSCVNSFVQANGTLGPDPYYGPWTTSVIHVHGPKLIPGKSYTIETMPGPSQFAPVQTWLWADTNNTGGPIDVDDLLCLLAAFAQDYDACGYGIEASDLMGCLPDDVIDVDDLLGLLSAFASNPYACTEMPCSEPFAAGPSGPEGPQGGGSSSCTITLKASAKQIAPGATKTVEGYVNCSTFLNANQLALQISGGTTGSLTLETITINQSRTDYGFYGLPHVPAIDVGNARVADALHSGGVTFSPEKYTASFVFRASTNASGTFTISLRTNETHLRDANRVPVNWENGGTGNVTVSSP
ncbi:MAG: hypothetical protein AABZ47_04085 [Planctomycetota bacterium]